MKINKRLKKNIKQVLILLGLWSFIKRIFNKDKGNPLNKNLLEEGCDFYDQFIQADDLVFDVVNYEYSSNLNF